MRYECGVHGRVRVPHPPKTSCEGCWAQYGHYMHAVVQRSKATSVGRARGGGQSSKKKGRAAVLVVAKLLADSLGLPADDVFVKATSQVGVDIHLSPVAQARFPFSIEVKGAETLNIWQALKQAADQAKAGLPPVVFFKRAHTQLYVALDAEEFITIARRP